MANSITIAEANKVRAALGMTLLPIADKNEDLSFKPSARTASGSEDQGSTLETRELAASDNWKKLQDEADQKRRRELRKEQLKRKRDAEQRFQKLHGIGLGEVEDVDLDDTRSWLLKSNKRQKRIEKARQNRLKEELTERDRQAQHTGRDLAGKRIGHEKDDFEAGGEQILTLKDAAVDAEDDEDELENIELREKEQLRERLELKKKKPIYDPNGDEGTILGQYDNELEGKKSKRFTLNGLGSADELYPGTSPFEGPPGAKGSKTNLDFIQEQKPVSDYLDISEVRVRKMRSDKQKSKKRKARDEDDIFPDIHASVPPVQFMEIGETDNAEVNGRHANVERSLGSASFIDDEDLQLKLAQQRQATLKNRKRTRPEDIARQLREEACTELAPTDMSKDGEDGGLILDETSEFVSNLTKPEVPIAQKTSPLTKREASAPVEADVELTDLPDEVEEEDEAEAHVKRETSLASPDEVKTTTGLDEEQTLDSGLGSTIAMLTGRGLMSIGGGSYQNADDRQRQKFLAERHRLEAEAERKARQQRERDRASGKFNTLSNKDREQQAQWENKHRDQQSSRQMADIFNKDYKPNVNLKYIDEHGRQMSQKEAFKHLSHQFHGKTSGKQKTEKHLKKIEDEKKREAMSSLDSSQALGMYNAMGATARKNRQAGVRLQ